MIGTGHLLTALLLSGYALAAALFVMVLELYDSLPETVAVDFGPDGRPFLGPKEKLLEPLMVMIGVGLAAALLITAIVAFRHTLVEKYPYLINLPALALILGRIADERTKREYIDRLFVPVALAPTLVLDLIAVTAILMLDAARTFSFNSMLMIELVALVIGGFLAFALSYYRSIYKQVKAMVT